jgi:periplasmic protein TonB
MLNVLLESKAPHTRRFGGTLASTLVHGAIITAAVLLTVQQRPSIERDGPQVEKIGPYIPVTVAPPAPRTERRSSTTQTTVMPIDASIPLPPIDHISTAITPVGPALPVTAGNVIGPALPPSGVGTGPEGLGGPPGEAIEARYVEKPPRVLRSEAPRFPDALRARGQGGRIVVQFVVDTLGRAEMSEFKVVDATDAQLADAVRAVLPRFRFTPGEAAGRKVRTMVALPFDFTLVR